MRMRRAVFLAGPAPLEPSNDERAEGAIQASASSCRAGGAPFDIAAGEEFAGLAAVCTITPLAGVTFRAGAATVSSPAEVPGDAPGATMMVLTDEEVATASATAPGPGRDGVAFLAGAMVPVAGPADGDEIGREGTADGDTGNVPKSIVFAGVAVRTKVVGPGGRESDCEAMPAVPLLRWLSSDSGVGAAACAFPSDVESPDVFAGRSVSVLFGSAMPCGLASLHPDACLVRFASCRRASRF
jgi:hypothetical protein